MAASLSSVRISQCMRMSWRSLPCSKSRVMVSLMLAAVPMNGTCNSYPLRYTGSVASESYNMPQLDGYCGTVVLWYRGFYG